MALYVNKETGELLDVAQMLQQFKDEYDGGDDTNLIHWSEYFDEHSLDFSECNF